jgi:hypothetical protein
LYTKLYIPYETNSTSEDKFLLVYSPLRIESLAAGLLSKLLLEGISLKEWITLFWLAERLKVTQKAKVYYCLALWGEIPKHSKNKLYYAFPLWFWPHANLDVFPQFKGDLQSQLKRNLGQLKVQFRVETRGKASKRELRRMGVGYRDKGSLSKNGFNWKDVPTDPEQVLHRDLLGRLKDKIYDLQIKKAKEDLVHFSKSGGAKQRKKSDVNPTEELSGFNETWKRRKSKSKRKKKNQNNLWETESPKKSEILLLLMRNSSL